MSDTLNLPEPIPAQVAKPEEYRRALLAIRDKPPPNMHDMLRLQYGAPGHTATASELARAAGYETHHPANRQRRWKIIVACGIPA